MDLNTLGEWSDGDDDWIWDIDESDLWEWSDPEADDIIRNVDESDPREWSDPEADDIIRNMDVDDSDLTERSDPESDGTLYVIFKQAVGRNVKATSRCYWKRTFTKKRA